MADRLRAALYLRVSDDRWKSLKRRGILDSGRGSMDKQERLGVLVIKEQGWVLTEIYADPDKGASHYSKVARLDWDRLQADIEAGKVDSVTMYESARGDRKLTTWSMFLDRCKDHGVLIHIVDHEHTYDVRRHRDWKTMADEGVKNESEANIISIRRRSTVRQMRAAGQPDGRVTYGYRTVYDPDTGKSLGRVVDEDTARHVRWLWEYVDGGGSIHGAVQHLQEMVPGRKWSRTGIRAMLTNPRYIGKLPTPGGLVEGRWPALVDPEVFWRISDQLKARGGVPAGSASRPGSARHLLSYVDSVRCWACEHPLAREKGSRSPTGFYICKGCRAASMRQGWLDEYVGSLIIARFARDDVRQMILDRSAEASTAVRALRDERAAVQRQLDEAVASASTPGGISVGVLAELERRLRPQLEAFDRQLQSSTLPSGAVASLLSADGIEGTREAWVNMQIAAQREVIGTTIDVRLIPGKRGARRSDAARRARVALRWIGSDTWINAPV